MDAGSVLPPWNGASTEAATRSRTGSQATWETWEVFRRSRRHGPVIWSDSVLWLGRAQLKGGASHMELDPEFARSGSSIWRERQDQIRRIDGFPHLSTRPSKPPGCGSSGRCPRRHN